MRKEPPDLILLDVNMPGIGASKRAVRFGGLGCADHHADGAQRGTR